MPPARPVRILRLHFNETDRYRGQPLHEAIVEKCRELRIAGATVFRGIVGYGETAEIHRHRLMTHDQPILVVIIDSAENVARLVPEVERMMETGMIALSDAEAIRVEASE
ncbi:MAG: DUF190 domain-containing protein [Pseudomonadota bacterium]